MLARTILVIALIAPFARGADFAIRDGDTVVFLGDSITAEGTCGRIVENYTLLRYPSRKVHFINAGHGGDTAAGGLARLEKDVFARGATLLTVAYGINDIGWGGKADDEHRQKFLDSIRGIVEQCKEHHVRVFICSAAVTAADPDKSENDYLQKMCDDGMEISRSLGEGSIDVQRTMRQIQRHIKQANADIKDAAKKETLHAGDGIHLNDLGQTAMAFAMIKGLGAPAEVSSVEIDASDAKLISSSGCEISNLSAQDGGIQFTRLDEGLPLNFGLFGALKFRFIPIPDEINRYMLTIKNLPSGDYTITVEGRALGKFASDRLAAGVNLSSATADGWQAGGPWEAQAWSLNLLTNSRGDLMLADKQSEELIRHLPHRPTIASHTAEINQNIEQLQRETSRPVPYKFVIAPAK